MPKTIINAFIAITIILSLTPAVFAQEAFGGVPSVPETTITDQETLGDNNSGLSNSVDLSMLSNSTPVFDKFVDDVSARLYYFNGSAGDVVTISMLQHSYGLNPYMVLLGPLGEVIATDDDSGNIALSSKIENVTLPSSGSYFLMAATSYALNNNISDDISHDPEMRYELRISGLTAPTDLPNYDPNLYTFYTGSIAANESVVGYSSVQEPIFYFLYRGTQGQVVDVNLASNNFDTVLHVFGDGGDRLAVNDDFNGTNSSIDNFVVPQTGNYLIFATDYWFYDAINPNGAYRGGEFTLSMNISQ